MLKIRNISKSFGNNLVLNDLNFEIGRGEIVYIYGRNGCGKSTLLKIICDVLKPDSGNVDLKQDIYIGALIENPGFIENETMEFNLKFLGSFKNKYDISRIERLCDVFALDFKSKSKMKSYSVGMRQKVGIIQAIMEDQNLILFDEPTRGLDDDSVVVFENIVNQLAKDGKSVIIASHEKLDNIQFNKQFLMKNGKLYSE